MDKKINDKSNAIYFLQGLLGVGLDLDEVKKNEDFYNTKFKTVANLYGFKDFSTMYKYCKNELNSADFIQKATATNEALAGNGGNSKSKEKDTSDLILATKTGTRNGHPYTSRYWTDPDKANKDKSAPDDDSSMQTTVDGLYLGGNEFGKPLPTTRNNSKPPASWSTVGTYKKSCYDFIYALASDNITFMSGLVKANDVISIQYASAPNDKDLLGRVHTLLSKVIKEAWLAGYGVEFSPMMFIKYVSITPFCDVFGLKLNNRKGTYGLTAKQLQDKLGDSECFRLL